MAVGGRVNNQPHDGGGALLLLAHDARFTMRIRDP
jgi:hypothetical protein